MTVRKIDRKKEAEIGFTASSEKPKKGARNVIKQATIFPRLGDTIVDLVLDKGQGKDKHLFLNFTHLGAIEFVKSVLVNLSASLVLNDLELVNLCQAVVAEHGRSKEQQRRDTETVALIDLQPAGEGQPVSLDQVDDDRR